jgi:hypothetical protein
MYLPVNFIISPHEPVIIVYRIVRIIITYYAELMKNE